MLSLFRVLALEVIRRFQRIIIYAIEKIRGVGSEGGHSTIPMNQASDQGINFTAIEEGSRTADLPSRPSSQTFGDTIDRLTSTSEEGKRMEPVSNVKEGGHIYAVVSHDIERGNSSDENEVEKQIASAPCGFGKIIKGEHQQSQGLSSPNNVLEAPVTPRSFGRVIDCEKPHIDTSPSSSKGTPDPLPSGVSLQERIEQLAASRSYRETEDSIQKGTIRVHRISNSPSEANSNRQGRYFYRLKETGELHRLTISPIPLDFNKPREERSTPTVSSHGTEQDCSSPLFASSCRAVLRQSYLEAPSPIENSRTLTWLLDVQITSAAESNEAKSNKSFGVWEDVPSDGSSRRSNDIRQPTQLLKDVTNLRRPGYLEHNSFFQSAKKARLGGEDESASPRRQNVLSEEPSPHVGPSSFTVIEAASRARAVDVASTLAKLEGLVIEVSPSPFKRFAQSEYYYKNDILLDSGTVERHHPRPARRLDMGKVLGSFERIAEETFGPELNETVGAGPNASDGSCNEEERDQVERPANPTPNRVEFHHEPLEGEPKGKNLA